MFLSTIRNKLLHEKDFNLDKDTRLEFINAFNFCASYFDISKFSLDNNKETPNKSEVENKWQIKKRKLKYNNMIMLCTLMSIIFGFFIVAAIINK